jgi:hypothetical protein
MWQLKTLFLSGLAIVAAGFRVSGLRTHLHGLDGSVMKLTH